MYVFTASRTLILLCNIYVSFVFTDPLAAQARNPGPAGMYVCHVPATGVAPYRNSTKTPTC